MASFEGVLANIPGLGGYLASKQNREQDTMQQIQQTTGVLGLVSALEKQQQEHQLRDALSESGGDIQKALDAAITSGNLVGAHALAPLVKLQNEKKLTDSFGLGGGAALTADQKDELAVRAAILGHPGAVGFARLADQSRAKENNANTLNLMRDTPQGLPSGAAVPGTNAVTTANIPPEDMAAFMQVAQATARGVPATASPAAGDPMLMGGGALAPLIQSQFPAIAGRAKQLQTLVNNPSYKGDPAYIQKEIDNLSTMDAKMSEARQVAANRPTPNERLKSVIGPDGKTPILVPESQAAGMVPYSASMLGGTASGREAIFNKRVILSANQAMKDLENVVQLPLTASTGILGGRKQGPGLFDAGREVLANKATSQEAQAYNAMATGFQRSLATIEASGLMPSGSLTHQMDAVIFKEGDTNLTKLHKLAQTRQIVESGLEVLESDDRVSKEIKDQVKTIISRVQKAVPFTHSDLIKLSAGQETNPNLTLKDVVNKDTASGSWTNEKESRYQELLRKRNGP